MVLSNQTETIDCRGMQCPVPILKTARAARSFRESGGVLEVLADDDAFPLDIESWCRSSQAELIELETLAEGYRARIRISGTAESAAAPVHAPVHVPIPHMDPGPSLGPSVSGSLPPQATMPQAMMSAEEPSEALDCRGMQCPAPIMKIARSARRMEAGGLLEVTADDPAFPVDVESWCRSAGATLVKLDTQGDVYVALIRKAGQGQPSARVVSQGTLIPVAPQQMAPQQMAPQQMAPQQMAPQQMAPQQMAPPADPSSTSIDLRGFNPSQQENRLEAFQKERGQYRSLCVFSDDPNFIGTVMAWCGRHGHQLSNLNNRSVPPCAEIALAAPVVAIAPQQVEVVKAPTERCCTLLVLHNDYEALLAALLVANGAASQGMKTSIFFSFWGLNLLRGYNMDYELEAEKKSFFARLFGWMKPKPKRSTALAPQRVSFMQRMFKMMMPSGPRKQGLGQLNFGGAGVAILGNIMKEQNIMSLPEMMHAAIDQDVKFTVCTMSMAVMGITKNDIMDLDNIVFGGVASFVEEAARSELSLVF